MNLHGLVRGAIGAVHADETLTLYRQTGKRTRNADLEVVPEFYAGETVKGQIQPLGAESIVQTERINQSSTVRRCYLYADKTPKGRPRGLFRQLGRSGDYLTDKYGQQWYVDAVLEDFSQSGWVSLQIILQQTPVEMAIKEDEEDEDGTGS